MSATDRQVIRAGARVELRRHTPENRAAFQRWYADPEIARLLRHDLTPLNERQSRSYFDTLILPLSARGFCWAIVDREDAHGDGAVIGSTALTEVDRQRRSALFRIVIGERERWGRGLGTETTRLVVEHAFSTLGLAAVRLEVFAHNPRARATYERVGFEATGAHVERVRARDVDLHVEEMTLRREVYLRLGVFASIEPPFPGGEA